MTFNRSCSSKQTFHPATNKDQIPRDVKFATFQSPTIIASSEWTYINLTIHFPINYIQGQGRGKYYYILI